MQASRVHVALDHIFKARFIDGNSHPFCKSVNLLPVDKVDTSRQCPFRHGVPNKACCNLFPYIAYVHRLALFYSGFLVVLLKLCVWNELGTVCFIGLPSADVDRAGERFQFPATRRQLLIVIFPHLAMYVSCRATWAQSVPSLFDRTSRCIATRRWPVYSKILISLSTEARHEISPFMAR